MATEGRDTQKLRGLKQKNHNILMFFFNLFTKVRINQLNIKKINSLNTRHSFYPAF